MSPAMMEVEQSTSHVSSTTRMRRGLGQEGCGEEHCIPILWQERGQCRSKLGAVLISILPSPGIFIMDVHYSRLSGVFQPKVQCCISGQL